MKYSEVEQYFRDAKMHSQFRFKVLDDDMLYHRWSFARLMHEVFRVSIEDRVCKTASEVIQRMLQTFEEDQLKRHNKQFNSDDEVSEEFAVSIVKWYASKYCDVLFVSKEDEEASRQTFMAFAASIAQPLDLSSIVDSNGYFKV